MKKLFESVKLIGIEDSNMPLVINHPLTNGRYAIEVDKTKEIYFSVDGISFYLYIHQADGFWFTNSTVHHIYQWNHDAGKESCSYCGNGFLEKKWNTPCKELTEKIEELIVYMRTKGKSRVKMLYELPGEFVVFDSAMERIGFTYDGDIEEWIQVDEEDFLE